MYAVVSTLTSNALSPRKKMDTLSLLAGAWILPMFLKHYLDYRKQFWRVSGSLRKHLQLMLLKKFLNYTDDSRSRVQIQALLMANVRDVSVTVSSGYLAVLDLISGSIAKIGMLVCAMLILQVLSTGTMELELEPLLPLIVVCCLPVPILIFLALRQRGIFGLQDAAFRAENASIDLVIATVLNYELVSACKLPRRMMFEAI